MGNILSVNAAVAPTATTSKKSTRSEIGGDKASAKASQTDKDAGGKSSEQVGKAAEPVARRKYIVPWPDQCGLENDGTVWIPSAPLPRIKTSRATPEEAAMYQRIVDACLHPDTVYGKRVNFDPNDVVAVCIEVLPYLASESVCIEDVPFGITVIGDLHGQLYDLDRALGLHAKDGKPGYMCSKYIFLGNYVDKGHQSLEIVMLLFCLKMLYPDNFFLLRGNHEFARINYKYGFGKELNERYCDEVYSKLFMYVNQAFFYLSLCAIIGDSYLCAHSGISNRGFTREELRNLTKPITYSTEDLLIHDMVWASPMEGLRGTLFNYESGSSFHFGLDMLVFALRNIGCKALFRGHTMIEIGFENLWDCCFTVFSSTSGENDASVVYVDDAGHMHKYFLLKCEERLSVLDAIMGVAGGEEAVERDAVGVGKVILQE